VSWFWVTALQQKQLHLLSPGRVVEEEIFHMVVVNSNLSCSLSNTKRLGTTIKKFDFTFLT